MSATDSHLASLAVVIADLNAQATRARQIAAQEKQRADQLQAEVDRLKQENADLRGEPRLTD